MKLTWQCKSLMNIRKIWIVNLKESHRWQYLQSQVTFKSFWLVLKNQNLVALMLWSTSRYIPYEKGLSTAESFKLYAFKRFPVLKLENAYKTSYAVVLVVGIYYFPLNAKRIYSIFTFSWRIFSDTSLLRSLIFSLWPSVQRWLYDSGK